MLEDKQLVFKVKAGDKDALRLIYEKYKSDLYTLAMSLLNETNAAEDVLHDVFLSFAKGIGQFQLYGSLKNYLTVCVLNRSRDMLRSKMYKIVEIERTKPINSDTNTPLQEIITTEELDIIDDALTKVPEPQREVILLHLQGGMKFREIAQLQNVSINTVQGRYRYGIEKLQSVLDGKVTE